MSDPRLFETEGPTQAVNVNNFLQVWKMMMGTEGMEVGFNVEAMDERPDRTLSKEAMETLRDNMIAWVGTRLTRYFKRTGRGAKKIQVYMVVSLDGQRPEFTDITPFFSWPDGEHREKAKR